MQTGHRTRPFDDRFDEASRSGGAIAHAACGRSADALLWLALAAGLGLAGCGGEPNGGDGSGGGGTTGTSTGTSTGTGTVTDPPTGTDCPDRLDPVAPMGQEEVVGDGTAASCTEAALRAAVETLNAVAGGGTIRFDCGGEHTITLTTSLFATGPLIVDGEGMITLSGGGATRVFELGNYADFVVQRLTITGGLAPDSGGAILHPWYGTLRAIDVRFEDNHAASQESDIGGGAVFAGGLSEAIFSGCVFANNSASNGGGLLNRGSTLTVVDCVFAGNRATSYADGGQYGNGGGLYIDGMNYDTPGDFVMCGTRFEANNAKQHGSAMFSFFYEGSRSYVDRCTFVDNHFDGSPSGGAGGVYHEAVPLTLTNSTIAGNRSGQHAAGLFIGSGSSADITSSTFADNVVPEVGAALFAGNNTVNIMSCTFAGNQADYAPAIFKGESGSITLTNTVFSNNGSPNQYSALACHEPLLDGGGNMQWPAQKSGGAEDTPCTDGITFADPLLQPLGDNGGPTPTMALADGSPAIDFGAGCPPTDQRGLPRSGACDAGAFERQP